MGRDRAKVSPSEMVGRAAAVRQQMVQRLREDLVGPLSENEVLEERPSDRYLTGILFPPGEAVAAEEDDSNRQEGAAGELEDDFSDVPVYRSTRPSTLGLSFRIRGRNPSLAVRVTGGRYEAEIAGRDGHSPADLPLGSPADDTNRRRLAWRRHPVETTVTIPVRAGFARHSLESDSIRLTCFVRAVRLNGDAWGMTLVVSNESGVIAEGGTWTEEHSLFQSQLEVRPTGATRLIPRPLISGLGDDEDRSVALLYRNVREWAVGHTAGAAWEAAGDACSAVHTDWLPARVVPNVSAFGAEEFAEWRGSWKTSASDLIHADDSSLLESLRRLTEAYRSWQQSQARRLNTLPSDLGPVGREHLVRCARAAERMDDGIAFLANDAKAIRAFRLANESMLLQRRSQTEESDLRWRPFQLAFQIMCLPSVVDRGHADRAIMDLLWFPTGGGKTEAYLGLIAFLLFYRRLASGGQRAGAGVAAIMRYTLRVLTTQQFQRAAAMICAAEELRQREGDLGDVPFSVGLWIGNDAIPNKIADARRNPSSLKVLTSCPRCGGQITNPSPADLHPRCRNARCHFSGVSIPVHVIDEEIYQVRPSLLVATVDKFAQITRERQTQALFSLDGQHEPPDLILQDELHLVSGPLGTLAGVYEVAIDEFCRYDGQPAKVIGSTATIRRAADQVRGLFNRGVELFPPPGLDHDDSGFAVVDHEALGRLYVGATSAGRSPKFALQAVLSSLLQTPHALAATTPALEVDPYWTCVAYFNSLRELGGAVVLVEDDVRRSIARLGPLRGEQPRELDTPSEITSRVPTNEIPDVLDRLASNYPHSEVDVVLASNMISVGVDIPRLGLMVVNGQPKTTAEYIQATSRVGRGNTRPCSRALQRPATPRSLTLREFCDVARSAISRCRADECHAIRASRPRPSSARAPRGIDEAFVSVVRR